tara:strand:- start:35650 stop:36891 length:1242 start_codon:yes stop_codon:yes gene_type:complete
MEKESINNNFQNSDNLEAKYGLPNNVQFCTRCVISNQRPSSTAEFQHRADSKKNTINFDEQGVCDACRYAEIKDRGVDWGERERKLVSLCDRFRSRNGSYDCLVPGSGGKDSVFASHILKNKYNMNPLTVTWAPHLYTDVGWRNFQNWLHIGGFDNYLFTPNGKVHRILTRLAFINLLHPFQPFILGQKNFAPKIAIKEDLPLVFYGENEAEYGNPIEENKGATRNEEYFAQSIYDETYLAGIPVKKLPEYGIKPGEIEPYMPGDPNAIRSANIEVHYLGYYLRWTPQQNYYYAAKHVDFEANTERTEGTFSKYNSIDDKTDPFHYWTTLVKFGIGRASYEASQEIRNGHIEREEGVALVHRYDQEFPEKFFPEFLDYLNLNEEEFFAITDKFRSPHLWIKGNQGWQLRHQVS